MAGAARPLRSSIVVAVDRLGAGFLGPYGNTWLDTPHINRLASQSLLVETALADSADLADAYRAYWTGRHALEPLPSAPASLVQLAREAGLHTVLITDEPSVAGDPLAAQFTEQVVLSTERCDRAATELDQAAMGKLFIAATNRLGNIREPALVWIHSRGMEGPWDAPLDLRRQFADEDDPIPPDLVDPPQRRLVQDFDPDELLGLVHAFAGQVALADAALGLFLDALDNAPLGGPALVALTSPRGYPLGEHRRVGKCDDALYGELIHVPLLVRWPDRFSALTRLRQLVQPCDLFATLAEWLGLRVTEPPSLAQNLLANPLEQRLPPRQLAVAIAPGQRAVRTRAWFLRESTADERTLCELFAKPDDRWEANEVSSRCQEVVELLAAAADEFRQAAASGQLAALAPLAETLVDIHR